jgi:hypothetical protein
VFSQLEEEERKKGDVSIPFTTKFIFCIIQYSIPVNSTYHTVEINELPKPDVFSVAPHANISTYMNVCGSVFLQYVGPICNVHNAGRTDWRK